MSSIETKIEQAIRNRVASLPMGTTHDIVWTTVGEDPGSYDPKPLKPYLRCTWTPNSTLRQTTGGREPSRRPGVLQIDVMGRKDRHPMMTVETAGQVAEHFRADLVMRYLDARVKVSKAPDVLGASIGTHVQVPVVIEVEAYE